MATLNQIADQEWEVLVIGGGIFGAAVARDAVMRGFKTALVERNDFAGETSGRSTKLVHGGIRYLEHLELGLVRECLAERTILLTMARHLVKPLPFLFPVFKGDRFPLPLIKLGTALYGTLAGRNTLKTQESFSALAVKDYYPFLANAPIQGAVKYYDAQMDDIRLCLETVLTAQMEGAQAANHTEVIKIGIRSDGKYDVVLKDTLSGARGKTRAQVLVNAAGPWADKLRSKLEPQHKPMLLLSKGIHLIVNKKFSGDAVVLSSSDKRIIFIIPWREGSIIGTTDTPFAGELEEVRASENDIEFLRNEVERITCGIRIENKDIITTFAGLRPLAALNSGNTAKASRKHHIYESPPRFFSIVGGKYTTHRLIAEQVCNKIEHALGRGHVRSRTAQTPLLGSFDLQSDPPRFYIPAQRSEMQLSSLKNLLCTYGGQIKKVLQIANRSSVLQRPLSPQHPLIGAQVIYAIEHEMARTLMDVCVRRLRLDQMPGCGLDTVGQAADLMAARLNWSWLQKEKEILEYQSWVRQQTEFLF